MSELFRDDLIRIEIGDVTLGHLKVFPVENYSVLEDIPAETLSHMFVVASRCATLLFEALKAEGTNIIIKNGPQSGQDNDTVCIDVIARNQTDGLTFLWEPKQGDQAAIKKMADDIKSKIIVYEKPVKKTAPVVTSQPSQSSLSGEISDEEKEVEDYLLSELRKIP